MFHSLQRSGTRGDTEMKVSEMDELVFLWTEYGKYRDSKLTLDAIELKNRLRKFVKSLPTFQELLEATQK